MLESARSPGLLMVQAMLALSRHNKTRTVTQSRSLWLLPFTGHRDRNSDSQNHLGGAIAAPWCSELSQQGLANNACMYPQTCSSCCSQAPAVLHVTDGTRPCTVYTGNARNTTLPYSSTIPKAGRKGLVSCPQCIHIWLPTRLWKVGI